MPEVHGQPGQTQILSLFTEYRQALANRGGSREWKEREEARQRELCQAVINLLPNEYRTDGLVASTLQAVISGAAAVRAFGKTGAIRTTGYDANTVSTMLNALFITCKVPEGDRPQILRDLVAGAMLLFDSVQTEKQLHAGDE